MTEKVCFKCNNRQPLSEFYKHKQMADGHLNKCKTCAKKDVSQNRADNIDYYLEYDKGRANNPNRVSAREQYMKTAAGLAAGNRAKRKWNELNVVKRAAHIMVASALREGSMVRPKNCSECSKPGRIHGHHDDYTKPLDVRWLCPKCHKAWHAVNTPRG